ncbi:CaiB/BaiF CoA transferase family protein [Rhizohabitans arisaemae]|uniref:CaiB/BaiF CoA transferase family protein n=1 Tax=Rhizohabitans arisaemae TaxID=2720610 RepID=UPI0024B226E4|nr:CoA transferase [Rhizohabitans arisaemae]
MNSDLPLSDVRVVDLSRFIAGPFCTQILADMGADVVKVERPGGEDARHHAPFLDGESLYVLGLNRNKRAMTLDTRNPAALAVLERMIGDSDVLVENYRPGTLAAMGLGPERLRELNPDLVVTSISGFGQTGPLAHRALFDAIAQAMSGLMSLTGEGSQPTLAGTYVADYIAGLYGALGTLFALRHRDRTGQGQLVDIASLDGLLSTLTTQVMATANLGTTPPRTGSRDALNAPANVFAAKDGHLYLHGGTNPLFPRLCLAMGRPELAADERFADVVPRMANAREIEEIVAAWAASLTVEEAGASLTAQGIPWGPVATLPEVIASPQVEARDMLVTIDHPKLGPLRVPGLPIKLSGSPGRVRTPPPLVGQDTEDILAELGYSDSEVAALRVDGAV